MKLKVNKIDRDVTDKYVYDISLDGTVVNALGMNVLSNTDGFNFQEPKTYRYTEENPYISTGMNRNTKKGEKYVGLDADVAEFNDLFMRGKMGLDVDEVAESTINLSRKNYADLLIKKGEFKVKIVGNTIKSKKMPAYIEKFIDKAIPMLLHGQGYDFLKMYYDYIEKIYNFQIPLRDIASRGKIKKTVEEYLEDCKKVTKAGNQKARQAWYELVIRDRLKVDVGDTIYYINTGTMKSHNDVQRIRYKEKIDKKTGRVISPERMEVKMNCRLLPREVVEAEEETFCDEYTEYNVPKYIDQFNKRVKALLVCFDYNIRDRILITDPKKRNYFTEEESKLVSGQPNKPTDQDTYEQLMTPDDREIRFWLSINEDPPFIKECNMDWEGIKKEYLERMELLKSEALEKTTEKYNELINALTKEKVAEFIDNGLLPKEFDEIVYLAPNSDTLLDKKYNIKIGSIFDIIDKPFDKSYLDETESLETGDDEFQASEAKRGYLVDE